MSRLSQRLVAYRTHPVVGRLAQSLLALYGIEIPTSVRIGDEFNIAHRGYGIVVHPQCQIGDRVMFFHGVTIGRADAHNRHWLPTATESIEIGDDVVLSPGAKVIAGPGRTQIGNGTIVGANAVLTTSTGEWEVWGGIPARKIGDRKPPPPLVEHYLRSDVARSRPAPPDP